MNAGRDRRFEFLAKIYKGLLVCLVVIGIIFAAGTIYGIFFRFTNTMQDQANDIHAGRDGREGQTFTGIGRLRVYTKDADSISGADSRAGMVVIFVSFVYYPDDKPFSEELVLRVNDFRNIIIDYIGSFEAAELGEKSENEIKADLRQRFNAILRLGKIETLFFSDFIVIE